MKDKELVRLLSQTIPQGRTHALHMQELARRWGVSCDLVKRRIRRGREMGLQIMSGRQGYWFATSDEEKETFCNTMTKQAVSRLRSIKATRQALRENGQQIKLDDVENKRNDDGQEEEKI